MKPFGSMNPKGTEKKNSNYFHICRIINIIRRIQKDYQKNTKIQTSQSQTSVNSHLGIVLYFSFSFLTKTAQRKMVRHFTYCTSFRVEEELLSPDVFTRWLQKRMYHLLPKLFQIRRLKSQRGHNSDKVWSSILLHTEQFSVGCFDGFTKQECQIQGHWIAPRLNLSFISPRSIK